MSVALKEKGFSLIELTVTVGLMGLVSLFTMKVMENQTSSQASIEATAEINMTVSTIAQSINDPAKCASMFHNQVASPAGTTTFDGLRYTVANPPAAPVTHQLLETRATHNIVYQHFFINDHNDIRLRGDTASGTATLSITFRVQPSSLSQKLNLFNQTNARTIIRHIPFNVELDGANRVLSCGSVVSSNSLLSQQNACALLTGIGAYWNASHPHGPRCMMREQVCPFDHLMRGFNADGSINCRPAEEFVRGEDIFDLSHTVNCNFGGSPTGISHRWVLVPTGPQGRLRIHCHL